MEIIRPDASFDIIGKIKLFVGVSTAFVALSLLLLMTKGINYGIDFTGGTLVQVQFKEARPIGDVRSALAGLSLGDTVIQNFGSEEEFLIRVEKSSGDIKGVESVVRTALIKKFGKDAFEMRRTEMVGPKVGADLRQKALSSMLFASSASSSTSVSGFSSDRRLPRSWRFCTTSSSRSASSPCPARSSHSRSWRPS